MYIAGDWNVSFDMIKYEKHLTTKYLYYNKVFIKAFGQQEGQYFNAKVGCATLPNVQPKLKKMTNS